MKKVIPFSSHADGDEPGPTRAAALPTGEALADKAYQWSDGREYQVLLMQRLIGCTAVGDLVTRFYNWCSDLGLADGIIYDPEGDEVPIALGGRRHHSASYNLSLDSRDLGRLRLSRRDRYSESELIPIEQALGTLARCLRLAVDFQALEDLVTRDPLTGLGNRNALHTWIDRELSRARRLDSPLALMMIDIDHFKEINDRFGHLGGDQVLRTIAEVFRRSTRGSDLLFRFGGDEFTILLPHTDLAGACDAARQIRKSLSQVTGGAMGLGGSADGLRPDISVGIASYEAGDNEESLLQRADTHLYHAKAQGRGMVCSGL